MPKLIMNEAAMELAMAKLGGKPVFGAPDGGLSAPGVMDFVDGEVGERWQPGDQFTKILVLASDACRDIVFDSERFVGDPTRRKRAGKAMTVPVCVLMEKVIQLHKTCSTPAFRDVREAWPKADKALYRDAGKRIKKKHFKGPVRLVRNKIGAHLDAEAIGDPSVLLRPDDLLAALGDSLAVLLFTFNLPSHSCAWIRTLGPSGESGDLIVETMFSYPLSVRWLTDQDGNVKDVGTLHISADPRNEIREHVLAAIGAYNSMVEATDSQLPKIWTAPSDEVRAKEEEGSTVPSSSP